MPTNLPKVPVLCIAQDQVGAPLAGGKFEARLDRLETYNGFVVPDISTGIADADGVCVLSLWPNSLGTAGSTYRVRAWHGTTGVRYLDGYAVVPDAPCALQDILIAVQPPELDMATTAAAQARAALALAIAAAERAEAAAGGGGVSPGGASFTHSQASPSSVWTVPHNLARRPSITVTDHLGNVVLSDVLYVDNNIVQVSHGAPIAGFAYCN